MVQSSYNINPLMHVHGSRRGSITYTYMHIWLYIYMHTYIHMPSPAHHFKHPSTRPVYGFKDASKMCKSRSKPWFPGVFTDQLGYRLDMWWLSLILSYNNFERTKSGSSWQEMDDRRDRTQFWTCSLQKSDMLLAEFHHYPMNSGVNIMRHGFT